MANLGIGIIGCGNISTSYLRLAPLFKGLEVRAVADVNMDAATARGAEFNSIGFAARLRDAGVLPGDRVGAYLPNTPHTVVAFLATACVGAVWSVCS